MLTTTRSTISKVTAAVGGVAALSGGVNSSDFPAVIIDVALGAAIWYGIGYGVCTLVIKYKK
jgi:fructose-bisphosphate aldolase class 1